MSQPDERHTLYRGPLAVTVSALLAAVFAVRAVLAATGASALSGPVWATFDAAIAVAALVRCFDRVVLTRDGLTLIRVGVPTRLVPGRIHQLVVTVVGSSVRLVAQETDGKRRLLGSRRVGSGGEQRLRELHTRSLQLLAGGFGAVSAAAEPPGAAVAAPRRCVRPACPAYRTAVDDDQCASCGDRTQRIPTDDHGVAARERQPRER